MPTDYDVIVREFPSRDSIRIYPIADVHYGALEHQTAEWQAFVDKIAADDNAYIILAGDLINNNTRSAVGSPFDDWLRPKEQKTRMVEFLKPIKDKIICGVSGNHERRSLKDADDDPSYDIFAKLDLEDIYRPNAAFIKLRIGQESEKQFVNTYKLAVTHGAGGGIYTGATVNRNERWGNVIEGIDCVIAGHTHKGTITRPSKIAIDDVNNKVVVKSYLVISCVSWQAYGSYAMQKMLLPTETARPILLEFSGKKHAKDIKTLW